MDSMDSRWADLPLGDRGGQAGGGQAGERSHDDVAGGPRRPAELLDQLRLRLERLADNHPSSPREPARGRGSAEGWRLDPPAEDSLGAEGDPSNWTESASGYEPSGRGELADAGDRADASDHADGGSQADADAGDRADDEPANAEVEPASAGAQDEWWSDEGADHAAKAGAGGLGGPLGPEGGAAEMYVPWFMSPEEGMPWFAAEPGQPGNGV